MTLCSVGDNRCTQVGILFFLFEFFSDQLLAFMVLSVVWLCEVYSVVSVRTTMCIRFFPQVMQRIVGRGFSYILSANEIPCLAFMLLLAFVLRWIGLRVSRLISRVRCGSGAVDGSVCFRCCVFFAGKGGGREELKSVLFQCVVCKYTMRTL